VHIWQGDADQMVPMAHADDMGARLPDATLHRLAGEGHVSIQHHIGEILDSISPA
jgi:pimeloyl-ACP methyl ester carboxylesterase